MAPEVLISRVPRGPEEVISGSLFCSFDTGLCPGLDHICVGYTLRPQPTLHASFYKTVFFAGSHRHRFIGLC